MRRFVAMFALAGLLLLTPAVALARDPVLDLFKAQVELEKRLLAIDLSGLERMQEAMQAAMDRLARNSEDLLRAEKEGEDSGGFNARSVDLRRAESEVADLISASQQLRATMASRRGTLELLQAEVKRMEEADKSAPDEVSGRWSVAIEPGAMKGSMDLRLDGTLISGVYQLAGGWKGSFRGTYVGGAIRLERIDTQMGFVAVYSGRLLMRGDEKRIEGTWEATNLAAGTPTAGTWVAKREAARQ